MIRIVDESFEERRRANLAAFAAQEERKGRRERHWAALILLAALSAFIAGTITFWLAITEKL